MKTKKLIMLIFSALFSFTGVTAQTYYYNTTKTFNENGYSYQCDKPDWGLVTLYNKANQYTYAPYEYKDGSPVKNLENLFPLIKYDNLTEQKCISIVNNAFSPAEKQRIKGSKADVNMIIDTFTGKVIEVNFSFFYTSPGATISVSTYRALELALKSQIQFTITDNGKKLKFIKRYWRYEIE